MTSRRTARYGTLLSVVLALFLTMALAACTDDGATPKGTPGSLLEGAAEREATQEAGPSATETPTGSRSLFGRATPGPTGEGESSATETPTGSRSLFGRATPGPTEEGESSATEPTAEPTVELDPCPPRQRDPGAAAVDPAATSPETDKEVLTVLFEETGGETWDQSGTWGGLKPIGQWPGVGVGAGTPFVVGATPTPTSPSPSPDPRLAGRVTSLERSDRETGST